jgi:hypothetical protein
MIAKFFNKTKPINTLIELVFLIVIYTIATFKLVEYDLNFQFILERTVIFVLLLFTVFAVNFIIRKNGLTKNNSYTLLLFILCITIFPFSIINNILLITHFFLLLAYRRIYSLRTGKDTKEKLFDSGFWIGIATLIYPWSFAYMVLIYMAIYIFNKRTFRNVLIPLIGFFTPILLYGVYLLAMDDFNNFQLHLKYSFQFLNYNSLKLVIPIALMLGYLLWVIFPTTAKIIAVNNEFRTSWFLLLVHLLIGILIIIPSPVKDGSEFLFLFFPASIILANYIQIIEERWFKEVFLYLFLLIAIIPFVI